MYDNIANALNMNVENVKEEKTSVVVAKDESDMNSDFELARNTIKTTIEKTSNVLDEIIEIAKDSESPRAFEVLDSISNTLANLSTALIKINTDMTKAKQQEAPQTQNITNNNMLVTTEDVIKRLREGRALSSIDNVIEQGKN